MVARSPEDWSSAEEHSSQGETELLGGICGYKGENNDVLKWAKEVPNFNLI
jgi:hypothetical protein